MAQLTKTVYEHEYVYAYVNKQKIEFQQATCVGSFEGTASFAAVAPCQLVLKFAYRSLQVFQSAPEAIAVADSWE